MGRERRGDGGRVEERKRGYGRRSMSGKRKRDGGLSRRSDSRERRKREC